jgi:tetratricopeptide (TPR) repeat protein
MKRAMLIAAAVWISNAATAWPIDQVYTNTAEKPYYGKITGMTNTGISFEPQGKGPTDIPANEIVRIIFGNSPDRLLSAQKFMLDGRYDKALDALEKDSGEEKRDEVNQEIAFCHAYCMAQLALSGASDPNEAGNQIFAFITKYPNSFHNLKACELMGDILLTLGRFPEAQRYYAMLGQTPWPDYKIRSQVALGRSYLAQGNSISADKAFDDALNNDAHGELAEAQRTCARIGKARCMVLTGKTDQALRTLDSVLDRADEKDPDIIAMAYNAQGTALRKAGKPKEAIRAFLRVHLVYATQPDLDAEAVANLEKLFTEDHKPKHASDMRRILNDKYKNSRWAKGMN